MKRLKKDYEEVDMELTVGVIQRRLRVGLETAKAIYNDLNAMKRRMANEELLVYIAN
ncbi:hypothetical protein [Enterococcus faecium]|uniref:hypothetical protein n=1 Tax=Enterococcus faecium TaxID=1352 RepID=UPI001D0E3A2C